MSAPGQFNLKNYLAYWAGKVEVWMDENVSPSDEKVHGLNESMRYSLFAGGKRMRPALVYSSYGIFDSWFDLCTPFAAAVEMLHTYSLIHDDLPAMDDDDMRRGKPTNHKVFGEATAILAGDALLTKAFEVMLNPAYFPDVTPAMRAEAAFKLAKATGDAGMVAGQFADMEAEQGTFDASMVNYIHENKTSRLISYCCELGAILGHASEDEKAIMRDYGMKIGLAFQVADDILDLTGTTEELGKDAGSDAERGKATYPAVHGVEKSRTFAADMINEAVALIEPMAPGSAPLIEIARYIIDRKN